MVYRESTMPPRNEAEEERAIRSRESTMPPRNEAEEERAIGFS